MVASFKRLFQGRGTLRKGPVPSVDVLACLSPPRSGDGEGEACHWVRCGHLRSASQPLSWDPDPMTRHSGGVSVVGFFFLFLGD